jgi:ABC-type transport system substrate-binding protein
VKRRVMMILLLVAAVSVMQETRIGQFQSGTYASPPALETYCTYYYGFNTTKAPVDNVHVRRALSYAVDRQTLIDAMLSVEGMKPAKVFACPGVFGSPAEDPNFQGIEFDPATARHELELAGYPGGVGLPKMTLMYDTSEAHQEIAEKIAAQWKEHLGIEVELSNQEWKDYLKTLSEDAPQIWRLGWCASYPGEDNWVLETFHSTEGANRIMWSNSEFDQLKEEATTESDPAKREAIYYKAEKILCVDEAGIIPVFYYSAVRCGDLGPAMQRTPTHPTSHPQVGFNDLVREGNDEVVVLENRGNVDADLTGWQLQSIDRASGQVLNTFTFPQGYMLPIGSEVHIHSGPAARSNPPEHLLWTHQELWGEDEGKAVLLNEEGHQRSSYEYYSG